MYAHFLRVGQMLFAGKKKSTAEKDYGEIQLSSSQYIRQEINPLSAIHKCFTVGFEGFLLR
jgi:hypothetical protein